MNYIKFKSKFKKFNNFNLTQDCKGSEYSEVGI